MQYYGGYVGYVINPGHPTIGYGYPYSTIYHPYGMGHIKAYYTGYPHITGQGMQGFGSAVPLSLGRV